MNNVTLRLCERDECRGECICGIANYRDGMY